MNWQVYNLCKQVARQQRTVNYQEVGNLIGLNMENPHDRDEISAILGEISTYEHANGRPLLSAVVVLTESSRPGGGFYGMANEVGLFDTDGDREAFFVAELRKVQEYWKHR